jgi:hypothetical protein
VRDAAVCEMYSLVELDILVSFFNCFDLGGKNGEVRFKIIDNLLLEFLRVDFGA